MLLFGNLSWVEFSLFNTVQEHNFVQNLIYIHLKQNYFFTADAGVIVPSTI